jgi:hypothetical protein
MQSQSTRVGFLFYFTRYAYVVSFSSALPLENRATRPFSGMHVNWPTRDHFLPPLDPWRSTHPPPPPPPCAQIVLPLKSLQRLDILWISTPPSATRRASAITWFMVIILLLFSRSLFRCFQWVFLCDVKMIVCSRLGELMVLPRRFWSCMLLE